MSVFSQFIRCVLEQFLDSCFCFCQTLPSEPVVGSSQWASGASHSGPMPKSWHCWLLKLLASGDPVQRFIVVSEKDPAETSIKAFLVVLPISDKEGAEGQWGLKLLFRQQFQIQHCCATCWLRCFPWSWGIANQHFMCSHFSVWDSCSGVQVLLQLHGLNFPNQMVRISQINLAMWSNHVQLFVELKGCLLCCQTPQGANESLWQISFQFKWRLKLFVNAICEPLKIGKSHNIVIEGSRNVEKKLEVHLIELFKSARISSLNKGQET